MNREELMNKIHALSFALTETQLFLDTHPDCRNALDYYRRLVDELDVAMTEYQNKYAPLFADATAADRWNWTDTPWPWQNNGNMKENNGRAEGGRR